jgi:hypothetical protein
MAIFIIAIILILYVILIASSVHNLYMLENKVKILYVMIGIALAFVITMIVFAISTTGIDYENAQMLSDARKILVVLFTPVNGLITMPYLANLLNKAKEKSVNQEQFKKKALILAVVFAFILVIECGYLKDIQTGTLSMLKSR